MESMEKRNNSKYSKNGIDGKKKYSEYSKNGINWFFLYSKYSKNGTDWIFFIVNTIGREILYIQ